MKKTAIFIATRLKKTHYDMLSLPLKNSKIICLHYQKRCNSNANNITQYAIPMQTILLSLKQFTKHN